MKKELYEELKKMVEKLWDKGELEDIRPYNMEDLKEVYGGGINNILRNIDYKNFNYYHDYFTIDDLGHIKSFISYRDHILKHSEEILDVYFYLDDCEEDLYNKIQDELKNHLYQREEM